MYQLVVILHVLGATIWTGGHLVLTLTILPRVLKRGDPQFLLDFEAGYERIGIPALLVQVVTGLWLAHRLLPRVGDWLSFATPVSTVITLKLLLLVATALLAVHARLRLVPKANEHNLPLLAVHIIGVTTLSVLFVLVGVGFRTGGFPW